MTNHFARDIGYLVSLTRHIDRMYSKNDSETHHYLKRLRMIISRFNSKYHMVLAALSKNYLRISLKMFIRKPSVDMIFKEIDKSPLGDSVFGTKGSSSMIALKHDPNRDMTELIYRPETLEAKSSPEYKLLEHYALTSVDETIDIKEDCDNLFSFDYNPDEGGSGILYTPRDFPGERVL
jgi:hypothetical protein